MNVAKVEHLAKLQADLKTYRLAVNDTPAGWNIGTVDILGANFRFRGDLYGSLAMNGRYNGTKGIRLPGAWCQRQGTLGIWREQHANHRRYTSARTGDAA